MRAFERWSPRYELDDAECQTVHIGRWANARFAIRSLEVLGRSIRRSKRPRGRPKARREREAHEPDRRFLRRLDENQILRPNISVKCTLVMRDRERVGDRLKRMDHSTERLRPSSRTFALA
jgi:hypothetical protein